MNKENFVENFLFMYIIFETPFTRNKPALDFVDPLNPPLTWKLKRFVESLHETLGHG